MKERKIRIEVGYGLEGTLTDARSAQIIGSEIVPRFRAGDVPGGVAAGVDAILKTIEGTYQASEEAAPGQDSDAIGQVVVAVIVGLIVGLGLMSVHRLLGPVAGTGALSYCSRHWLVPALITGGVTLLLLTLISVTGTGGRGRGRHGGETGFGDSSRSGGWGGGSFGSGGGGFSGGGGDFGGGGASGNW